MVAEDHSVTAVALNWKCIVQLAEFFLPRAPDLPEFDSVNTCTVEQETLLKKIVALIPAELDPKHRVDDIHDFVMVGYQILMKTFRFKHPK